MSPSTPPRIECQHYHTTLYVTDVLAAVDFYTNKLGFQLGFTWGEPPELAGVNLGEVRIFLAQGTPNPDGCSVQFVVGDADELYAFHRANGLEVVEPIEDRPYGMRDYAVRDLSGYILGFGLYIYSVGPAVEIERVDVPMRLEKRLAALLQDLAAHKRMSLTSCLEEILLHTCEPFGDGVASPHTSSQLRHIQELKARHGIDYDSHASYRFVEKDDAPFRLDGIDHVALAVRDVEHSARWYQETLGLQRLYQEIWGSHPAIVGLGTTSIALFPVGSENPKPQPTRDTLAMRHLAFRANRAAFEKARKELPKRGITPEFQDHQAAHSIYFQDPDGHRIEITTYELGP
jgi:catechol 2,3-dioxygenase-like lactoylglutathione lyase family enzyme